MGENSFTAPKITSAVDLWEIMRDYFLQLSVKSVHADITNQNEM